jgi:hypothetical protein
MAEGHGWAWCAPRALQPPRAGSRNAKASQAFTPSLLSQGGELNLVLTREVPTKPIHNIKALKPRRRQLR